MKFPQPKLSPQERENLLVQLQQTASPKSSEIKKRMVTDQNGITRDLGGTAQGVIVDGFGIPKVMEEEQASILDCGHLISSLSEVLGKCGFDHLVCHRHNLLQCIKCGKILCHLCAALDEGGNPSCPDHDQTSWWPVVGALAIFAVITIFIFGNN